MTSEPGGPRRPTRLILAHASHDEAINHLVTSMPPAQEDIASAIARWREVVEKAERAGERPPQEPELDPLPNDLQPRAEAVQNSPSFQFLLSNMQPEFRMVSLEKLIAIQKMVYVDDRLGIAAVNPWDTDAIFRITVPDPVVAQLPVVQDQNANSYTMVSENPNLRIGGMAQADAGVMLATGGQMPLKIHGFLVTYGGPWMQAACIKGRWFLRDGYHRAYALLRRGIRRAPCIVVRLSKAEELGVARPGFVGLDVLFGNQPPYVRDFIDDVRSVDGSLIPMLKVIRIKAEEFVVPAGS